MISYEPIGEIWYMTRKQALIIALDYIKEQDVKDTIMQMIKSMPLHEWDKATIFDAISQFILDIGRVPTPKDFKYNKLLPKGATVQNRFNMPLNEFLKKYFPNGKQCDSNKYHNKTTDEWLAIFIAIYKKIKPHTAKDYNEQRDKNTPTWFVFARLLGLTKWNELLLIANLKTEKQKIKKDINSFCQKSNIKLSSYSDLDF